MNRRTALQAVLGILLGGGCRPSSTSGGKKELALWSMWSGQEELNFQHILEIYAKVQTKYTIHNLGAVSDDTKTIRALVAGVPPDVFTLSDPSYLGPLARNGALQSLDERFERSGLKEKDFVPGSLDMCRYRGKLYAMPYLIDETALLWDRTAFQEAGLEPDAPPSSLDELKEYALKLTRRDASGHITRLGLRPLGDLFLIMHLYGGQMVDPATGKITADHPGNIAGLTWYQDLVTKLGGIAEVNAFSSGFGRDQGASNPFYVGKVAMILNGEWNPYWVSRYAPQLSYRVAPCPAPKEHPELAGSTWLGGNLFCIPNGSRFPDEAWEFLHWTQSMPAQIQFANSMNNIPNQLEALHSPKLREGAPFRSRYSQFLDMAENRHSGSFPVLPVTNLYLNQLSTAIDRALYGELTPEQALREVRKRVQRELDRA